MIHQSFYSVFTVIQIVIVAAVLGMIFTLPLPWDWQRCLGTALVIVGVAGIAAARYQLGKSFSFTPQARQLVTGGIYSKIRNPIYVFGTVAITGMIFVIHRPIGWLFLAVVVILQTVRAHREAHVLETAFGDDYREYRRKTWF